MDRRSVSPGIAGRWRQCLFFHEWPPPQPESVSAPRSESSFHFPPCTQQTEPIGRRRYLPLDAHFASTLAFEIDSALMRRSCVSRGQFAAYRLGCLASEGGNSAEPPLQPHI